MNWPGNMGICSENDWNAISTTCGSSRELANLASTAPRRSGGVRGLSLMCYLENSELTVKEGS